MQNKKAGARLLFRLFIKFDEMDAFYRTILCTKAASNALIIINARKIILDLNRICGAYLLAFGACNASIRASTARIRSLILVIAHHNGCRISRHERDDRARTGLCAKTATNAKLRIHVRNAVLDTYRAYVTDRHTLTVAKTSVSASTGAAIHH